MKKKPTVQIRSVDGETCTVDFKGMRVYGMPINNKTKNQMNEQKISYSVTKKQLENFIDNMSMFVPEIRSKILDQVFSERAKKELKDEFLNMEHQATIDKIIADSAKKVVLNYDSREKVLMDMLYLKKEDEAGLGKSKNQDVLLGGGTFRQLLNDASLLTPTYKEELFNAMFPDAPKGAFDFCDGRVVKEEKGVDLGSFEKVKNTSDNSIKPRPLFKVEPVSNDWKVSEKWNYGFVNKEELFFLMFPNATQVVFDKLEGLQKEVVVDQKAKDLQDKLDRIFHLFDKQEHSIKEFPVSDKESRLKNPLNNNGLNGKSWIVEASEQLGKKYMAGIGPLTSDNALTRIFEMAKKGIVVIHMPDEKPTKSEPTADGLKL